MRGSRVWHSFGMDKHCNKSTYRGWAVGRWSNEEFRNISWAGSHGVREVEVQVELILLRDVKLNKRSFCCYIKSKRLSKENVGLLLNGTADTVTTDR